MNPATALRVLGPEPWNVAYVDVYKRQVYCGKVKDALVLDMGGTTTDIAVLSNEVPKINDEGAVVGGWRTRVRAAEISTYGIGGDSYIQIDKDKNLVIGPNRVWPDVYKRQKEDSSGRN